MDGVGNGGRDTGCADFTNPLDPDRIHVPVVLVDEDHVDVRDVGVDGQEVFRQVGVQIPSGSCVDGRVLPERHAEAVDDASDQLAASGLAVQDPANAVRGDDA